MGPSWPYSTLVDQPAAKDDTCNPVPTRVVRFHPEESYILNKLTGIGMCTGVRMPRLQDPKSPEQIQLIADWICQGAQNN